MDGKDTQPESALITQTPIVPEEPSLETAAEEWKPDEAAAHSMATSEAHGASPTLNISGAPPTMGASGDDAAAATPRRSQSTSQSQPIPSTDSKGYTTLIHDPYGISTVEISEQQNRTDELDLDEDLSDFTDSEDAESNEEGELKASTFKTDPLSPAEQEAAAEQTFLNLSEALAQENERHGDELEALAPDAAQAAAEHLAAQIAEDEALAQQLAVDVAMEALEEVDPELQAALPKAPALDAEGNLDLSEVESCVEALLFMTDKPMSVEKLQALLGPEFSMQIFLEALTSLRDRYQNPCHGFELVEVAGGMQFRTKPGRAALAKKLARVQTQRLSSGAMETLAIVAYRQPALKDDIDKIRGVDSSHFIRGLMDKKLIKIDGRSDLPGRPMVYSTTPEFLELFSLKNLGAMPSLRELEQMVPGSQSENPSEVEDPRVKEMRRLVGEMKANSTSILDYDPREDEKILNEIRERVHSIPTSTPSIEEQKAQVKAQAEAAKAAATAIANGEAPQPGLEILLQPRQAVQPQSEVEEEDRESQPDLDGE